MTFEELVKGISRSEDNQVPNHVWEGDLLHQIGLDCVQLSSPDVQAYWVYKYSEMGYLVGTMLVYVEDDPVGLLHIDRTGESHMTWVSKDAQSSVLSAYMNCRELPKHDFIHSGTRLKDHYNVRFTHQLNNIDLSTVTVRGTKPYKIERMPESSIGSEHGLMVQMTESSRPVRMSLSIIDIPIKLKD